MIHSPFDLPLRSAWNVLETFASVESRPSTVTREESCKCISLFFLTFVNKISDIIRRTFSYGIIRAIVIAVLLFSHPKPSLSEDLTPDPLHLPWSTKAVSDILATDRVLMDSPNGWLLLPAGYISQPMTTAEILVGRNLYYEYLNTPYTPDEAEKWASDTSPNPEDSLPYGPGAFAYMLPSGLPLPPTYFSNGVGRRNQDAPFEAVGRNPDLVIVPIGFESKQFVVRFSWISSMAGEIDKSPLAEMFKRLRRTLGENDIEYREGPTPTLPRNSVPNPSGTVNFSIYGDNGDMAVNLNCTPWTGDKAPPNPGCHGYVLLRSYSLGLYITFPSAPTTTYEGEAWRVIVENTALLARSWEFQPFPVKAND